MFSQEWLKVITQNHNNACISMYSWSCVYLLISMSHLYYRRQKSGDNPSRSLLPKQKCVQKKKRKQDGN